MPYETSVEYFQKQCLIIKFWWATKNNDNKLYPKVSSDSFWYATQKELGEFEDNFRDVRIHVEFFIRK